MFSKKIISSLIVILMSLNFDIYAIESKPSNLDSKLSVCLDLIHNYYDNKLISLEYDELAKMKRMVTGILLLDLPIPKDFSSNYEDYGQRIKIQEIMKSGNSIQKEAAVHLVNYLMFLHKPDSNVSSCEANKVYIDRVSELFLSEQKLFLELCIDLINKDDTDINVSKACYDLFIQYFLKSKECSDFSILMRVIEIGLNNNNILIQTYAQILNSLTIQGNCLGCKKVVATFRKDALVKNPSALLNAKFVDFQSPLDFDINALQDMQKIEQMANQYSDCDDAISHYKALCLFNKLVANNIFTKQMKFGIEKTIKSFKYTHVLNSFIYLCNKAIDKNVEVKSVIEIMNKITLESCSYDFHKDLLKVCTRLTQYPDFLFTGLRFVQDYNQMGGIFSYGDEYYIFCNRLMCNNLELICTVSKLKGYVFSDLQNYKMFSNYLDIIKNKCDMNREEFVDICRCSRQCQCRDCLKKELEAEKERLNDIDEYNDAAFNASEAACDLYEIDFSDIGLNNLEPNDLPVRL